MNDEIILGRFWRKAIAGFGLICGLPLMILIMAIKGAWREVFIETPLELDSIIRLWKTGRTNTFKE